MSVQQTRPAVLIFLVVLTAGMLFGQVTITSPNALLPASVAVMYEPYNLTATGGTPPYTWTVVGTGLSGLPNGMALSSTGTISGQPTGVPGQYTPQIKVTDTQGAQAIQQFSLFLAASAGTLSRTAAMAQVAAGAGWDTTIYLISTSTTAYGSARMTFRNDNGSPLFLALTLLQQGISQSISLATWDFTLAPNTTIVIHTAAPPNAALQQGWADVLTTGQISSFAIFKQTLPNGVVAEGTSLGSGPFPASLILPFDNTANFVTTAGLVNLSANPSVITATIWDENGVTLGSQSMMILTQGHTAFSVPAMFPSTAGKRGVVRFENPNQDGGLAGLGLSFSPLAGGSFTSVPMIAPTM